MKNPVIKECADAFASAMLRKMSTNILIIFAIAYLFSIVFDAFKVGFDATDGEYRSGMSIQTDSMTGCEYLSFQRGGLTPRLDVSGHHICAITKDEGDYK